MTSTASRIWPRMIRAMKLDAHLYEEVEHDPNANSQGLLIIAIVSIAQAIGLGLNSAFVGESMSNILVIGLFGFLETVIGLVIWSYILYFIGTKLFRGVATMQEVWRCTSFARSPGIFFIIPIPFFGFLVSIWIFVAYIIGARAALDISTGRTLIAAFISAIPFIIMHLILVVSILQSILGI